MKSNRTAAMLTLGYLLLCGIYIVFSTRAAFLLAPDAEHLAQIEQVKGILFILVSGLIFFGFARRVLLKIELREQELFNNQQALMQAERRSMAGTLAASAAHDMNNILTIAGAGVEELADPAIPPPQRDRLADQVRHALSELGALSGRLASLGKEGLGVQFEELNLLEAVAKSVELAQTHRRIRSCRVTVGGAGDVRLRGSRRLLDAMILNLLLNSADATNGRGRIEVRVARRPEGGGILEVCDDGPGVSAGILETLFTPFKTTKPNGTGLGLVSVRTAAQLHGGSVDYEPAPGGGSLFRVILPGAPTTPTS